MNIDPTYIIIIIGLATVMQGLVLAQLYLIHKIMKILKTMVSLISDSGIKMAKLFTIVAEELSKSAEE
ncbi:MAG TPA: hypothetical protein ENF47_02940 [Thermoprotei archaeon]|nr:hypothetical protein [Thermoprotei archaeon]